MKKDASAMITERAAEVAQKLLTRPNVLIKILAIAYSKAIGGDQEKGADHILATIRDMSEGFDFPDSSPDGQNLFMGILAMAVCDCVNAVLDRGAKP